MKKAVKISALLCFFVFGSCISTKGVPYKKKPMQFDARTVDNVLDHSLWDKLLKKNVNSSGLVDYKGFVNDKTELEEYIAYLSSNIPKNDWTYEEQLAYFINVYNANTIKLIVDHYPVVSIKKVDATISPFLKNFIQIGDEKFSLADIEKGFLQKMNDPRIHFAINCASISCPKLMQEAYTAENVNSLMDQAAKEFINSDKNNISKKSAKISEIFKWYKKDFLKQSESIIAYINQYADTKIEPNTALNYIDYNWNLNDVE